MADTEDLAGLARRYLDLWQRQMTETATDPQIATGLQAWLAAIDAAAQGNGQKGDGDDDTGGDVGTGAHGTAATAAAHWDGAAELLERARGFAERAGRGSAVEPETGGGSG